LSLKISPKVSVGVPVYNGARTLAATLDSLIKQTFSDLEIIISDNASTDSTGDICRRYADQDTRIRYIRQNTNIGAEANFEFVLLQARAPYFMWAASDDIRSPDFLEQNVNFLDKNPDYVASTCPNCLEGRDTVVRFSMEGTVAERFAAFLDNSWISHGIFYSVVRTDILRGCRFVGERFLGADWAVDLYLASKGNIHRTRDGLMISGASGVSSQAQVWRVYRTHPIGWVFPFYRVSSYAMKLSSGFSLTEKLWLVGRLLKLNACAAYYQMHAQLYPFYSARIKPWIQASSSQR